MKEEYEDESFNDTVEAKEEFDDDDEEYSAVDAGILKGCDDAFEEEAVEELEY